MQKYCTPKHHYAARFEPDRYSKKLRALSSLSGAPTPDSPVSISRTTKARSRLDFSVEVGKPADPVTARLYTKSSLAGAIANHGRNTTLHTSI